MQKNLDFDTPYTLKVTKETIKGFLLHFAVKRTVAGVQEICEIADLNTIQVDIILTRAGQDIHIHEGYLEELLIALYGQTPAFQLNKKKLNIGYLVNIDLSPFAIALQGTDELTVKIKVPRTAFVGTTASESNIEFVSLAAKNGTSSVPVVKSYVMGKDEVKLDMDLGSRIMKIIAETDFTATYELSQKSKLQSMELRAANFEKSVNENVVLAENIHYLDMNPDTDIEDLVLYWGEELNDVKLKAKLSKGADINARVITLGATSAY